MEASKKVLLWVTTFLLLWHWIDGATLPRQSENDLESSLDQSFEPKPLIATALVDENGNVSTTVHVLSDGNMIFQDGVDNTKDTLALNESPLSKAENVNQDSEESQGGGEVLDPVDLLSDEEEDTGDKTELLYDADSDTSDYDDQVSALLNLTSLEEQEKDVDKSVSADDVGNAAKQFDILGLCNRIVESKMRSSPDAANFKTSQVIDEIQKCFLFISLCTTLKKQSSELNGTESLPAGLRTPMKSFLSRPTIYATQSWNAAVPEAKNYMESVREVEGDSSVMNDEGEEAGPVMNDQGEETLQPATDLEGEETPQELNEDTNDNSYKIRIQLRWESRSVNSPQANYYIRRKTSTYVQKRDSDLPTEEAGNDGQQVTTTSAYANSGDGDGASTEKSQICKVEFHEENGIYGDIILFVGILVTILLLSWFYFCRWPLDEQGLAALRPVTVYTVPETKKGQVPRSVQQIVLQKKTMFN